MKSDFNILVDAADDDSLDNHRNAPRPDPACLYGLVGDVARAGSETTEANPYAVAANFIAFMSCAVGRGPCMPVGCWRRFKIEPPCRLNFEPGLMANL